MGMAQVLAPVIDAVFPPRCPLCGEGLSAQTGLCAGCWNKLVIPGEPCCALCQRPFAEGIVDGSACGPCLASPPRHDGIAAATLYNDVSRQLVLGFKHGGRIALAPLMARQIAAKLSFVESDWRIVPVPLHRWRLWRRGYNQSALLAGEIARIKGCKLVVDGLVRNKRTPMLGGLGRKARERALQGAIAIDPEQKGAWQGLSVLLVDDVMTSGATSEVCVRALKRAGAKRVVIACFARVLDEAIDVAG